MKSFLWNLKMDLRSIKRRWLGNPASRAAKKGHSARIHAAYERDVLIRERGMA